MKLVLEIKNPAEWEILLAFLSQKGIDFHLTSRGKKISPKNAEEEAVAEKLLEKIEWKFSDHVFPGIENQTFGREEIYEDANWEKDLY